MPTTTRPPAPTPTTKAPEPVKVPEVIPDLPDLPVKVPEVRILRPTPSQTSNPIDDLLKGVTQ